MKCPLADKGCGGCTGLNTRYGDLLAQKQAAFRCLFPEALPIVGAENPTHFRNKVLRSFADGKESLYHGLYRRGTHQILSVRTCALENERATEIANTALRLLTGFGLPAYREDFHRGILRHLLVRRVPGTGQALVTVITGSEHFPHGEEFAKALLDACPDVRGVLHNINPRNDSAVLGPQTRLLAGQNEIWDHMNGLEVCLNAGSFYQINTAQAEKLYARAVSLAALTPEDEVLDAYCGVGVIGMLAAAHAKHVTGVELVADAVFCARKAARKNSIQNGIWLCQDAANYMTKAAAHPDVVFVDPPRAGCSRVFLNALLQCAPRRIVYISCCPQTLRRDVDLLKRGGYLLDAVQPYDLFPYTEHVESVVKLTRAEL